MPKHKYYWRVEFKGSSTGEWLFDPVRTKLGFQPDNGYDTRKQARHHIKQTSGPGDILRIVKVAR